MCPHPARYVCSSCYICVLILLYMCSDTAMYVSAYSCVRVLILLYMCPQLEAARGKAFAGIGQMTKRDSLHKAAQVLTYADVC